MDAMDEAVAQSLVLQFDVFIPLNPPGSFQLVVELLDLDRGELVQPDGADAGDDVLLDVVAVVVRSLLPDGGFRVGFKPQPHPLSHRVFAAADDVHLSVFFNGPLQLFLTLFLGFRQHIFVDGFACYRVAASCVAALPAAIGTLAQASLAVCPFLSRGQSPPEYRRRDRPCTRPST